MDRTVTQVYLMVSDLDESVAFYREAMGLELEERGEGSAQFDTGRCKLKIESDFPAETLAEYGLDPPGERRGDGAIVVVDVDDVDDAHDTADRNGADVLMPPREVPWGRRMFLVRDPDGYVLEVSTPSP